MGPKKTTTERLEANSEAEGGSALMEMLRSMQAEMKTELSNINSKLDKIDSIETEVKSLKILLNDLKQENIQLKTEARNTEKKLADMNDRNNHLENRLNRLEQHHRGWSARVLNIPLSKEEEADNNIVRDKVYNLALLPILRGAVEKKLLVEIPKAEQLLELAHVLPGTAGQPKPVIMRFYNRNVRDVCFRLKKHYAPREEPRAPERGAAGGAARFGGSASSGENIGGFEGKGRYCFPLYEDLTKAAFQKMRALSNDARVKACWSVKGQIKFTLVKKPEEVRRVESLLDSIDDILK